MTASPMNFSTVPPALELGAEPLVVRAQDRLDVLGSSDSAREVKPTRSAKRTVTTLRSSRPAAHASKSGNRKPANGAATR